MKKVWNKFLELKTSPTFMLVAFIGLVDLLFWLLDVVFFIHVIFEPWPFLGDEILIMPYFVYRFYTIFRIFGFWYFIPGILILFFLENKFKIKVENNFVENNKIYTKLWKIGTVTFIITTLMAPLAYGPLQWFYVPFGF